MIRKYSSINDCLIKNCFIIHLNMLAIERKCGGEIGAFKGFLQSPNYPGC